jgi:hypothetical protein
MTENERSLIDKLTYIDRRYIFVLQLALMVLVIYVPIGLPISVGQNTQDAFDAIDNLAPGSFIIFNGELSPTSEAELGPGTLAFMHHMYSLDVKIIHVLFRAESAPGIHAWYDSGQIDMHGKEYGVDYVFLGYVPGEETAMVAFEDDILGIISVDAYGNDLASMPIIQEFKGGFNGDLLVSTSGGYNEMRMYRTISVPNNIPAVAQLQGVHVPEYTPFYPDAGLVGYLSSQRGGAEYEKLVGKLGLGTQAMDAQSLIHLLAIAAIIMRNITYQIQKGKGD